MKSVKVYLYVSAPPEPTDMFVFPTWKYGEAGTARV